MIKNQILIPKLCRQVLQLEVRILNEIYILIKMFPKKFRSYGVQVSYPTTFGFLPNGCYADASESKFPG